MNSTTDFRPASSSISFQVRLSHLKFSSRVKDASVTQCSTKPQQARAVCHFERVRTLARWSGGTNESLHCRAVPGHLLQQPICAPHHFLLALPLGGQELQAAPLHALPLHAGKPCHLPENETHMICGPNASGRVLTTPCLVRGGKWPFSWPRSSSVRSQALDMHVPSAFFMEHHIA